ncbi:hypothetical protein [Acinetobacter sp. ANC 3791]|uniref:hypothetical protein n=1 Tax=Acinetobacter sp. ANC 3791 TaxID=2529836 RepID=UPI00103CCF61|nr:hypothetical protein [Acinetobacter sp. ANC 3791]TCB86315.1 hypothetical protein E0H90_00375 [Acinetobacter sp. ANC 3791]
MNPPDYDLVSDTTQYDTPEEVLKFKENLNDIPYLWRFIENNDARCPMITIKGEQQRNYFWLRNFTNSKREKHVSLMQVLDELIQNNPQISNEHDLFFSYMCRKIKQITVDNTEELLLCNSLKLVFYKLFQEIESSPIYLDKLKDIKLSRNQAREPYVHHWDLSYHSANDSENPKIIELLINSSEINNDQDVYTQRYIDRIYNIDLNAEDVARPQSDVA